MKIVLLTSKLNFETAGGSVADLDLKARVLQELGHEVSVITVFSRANKIVEPLPYTVYEEEIMAGDLIGTQRGAYKILKKYENLADIFYVDGHIFLYGGGLYRMLGGIVPIIAFFNIKLNCLGDTWGSQGKNTRIGRIKKKIRIFLERYLGAFIANHLDSFIFTAPTVEKIYLDFGFKKSKSNILPDFVNTQRIVERTGRASERLISHHQDGKINIFCSGRMIAEKGFDLVLNAFADIRNKDLFYLIISGDGPDRERLQKLSESLGIDLFVEFPGWVSKERLHDFFCKAHIFILPKWWPEYTSVLLIEAMAYGLPCIVPGGGGLAWLAENGVLTFKQDDAGSLKDQIGKIGGDIDLRIKLSKSNIKKALELDYKVLGRILENICINVRRRPTP